MMTELEHQLLNALEQLRKDYAQSLDEWENACVEWRKISDIMQQDNARLSEQLYRLSGRWI